MKREKYGVCDALFIGEIREVREFSEVREKVSG